MADLKPSVKVVENNDDCVIFEVKKNQFNKLIACGCFDGHEKLMRITKKHDRTYTIWTDKGHYDWQDSMLVVEKHKEQAKLLLETAKAFGIEV